MYLMHEALAKVTENMSMTQVEQQIMDCMAKGYSSSHFTLTDDISEQSDTHIHRLGMDELKKNGYEVERTDIHTIKVSGWIIK